MRIAASALCAFCCVVLALGCGDSDSDGSSGPTAGQSCATDGEEACTGKQLMECKNGAWTLDNDCGAKGESCVMKSAGEGTCE